MKKRLYTFSLLYLCMVFLLSCSFDSFLELEHKLPEPRAVLNATLCPDSVISVKVSHTAGYLQFEENVEKEDYYIEDASVEVFINGVNKGVMSKDTMPGKYILPNYYPSEGDHVRMEVQTKDYEAIASEVLIPSKAKILSVDTALLSLNYRERDSTTNFVNYSLNINVRIKDLEQEKNFYMIRIAEMSLLDSGYYSYAYYTVDSFYDKEIIMFDPYSRMYLGQTSFIFSDELISGKEHTFQIKLDGDKYMPDSTFISSLKISLYSISESFYRYRYSKALQYTQSIDVWGPVTEPIPTYSNVKNGYGLLAAMQVDTYDVIISHKR